MSDFLWWRDGIIYQIYPRSFADSNADGFGDLPGIASRLDYLSDLGIDAIWLSPFYPSPDKDFGYDISDYCAVDPRYGSMADLQDLIQGAHGRGIRVVLDMVMNHTSDQHPWFQESRRNRTNPKRDWYIWQDKPNNWAACFGGSAWEHDAASGQYYLHLFTRQQPDVNWRNPQVRQAQLEAFRFWMERGVDGFRLDVFNAFFKHSAFPDNPLRPGLVAFERQHHIHDMDQAEMLPLLTELRSLLDSYPERYAVGETYLATPQKSVSYCGADKLHAAFSFDFNTDSKIAMLLHTYPWNAEWVRERIARREAVHLDAGIWPTTVMANHDVPRTASRFCRGEQDGMAKLAMALLLTLRGTPFMYYGEEIGMRDLTLKHSEIMDPPGRKYWPLYQGRDGCRSPMQWDTSPYAGFSTARPWLRLHPNAAQRNVALQAQDPASLYHFTRRLIALRRQTPALQRGSLSLLERQPTGILAYMRSEAGQHVLVAMNFSRRSQTLILAEAGWRLLFDSASGRRDTAGSSLPLQPGEVILLARE